MEASAKRMVGSRRLVRLAAAALALACVVVEGLATALGAEAPRPAPVPVQADAAAPVRAPAPAPAPAGGEKKPQEEEEEKELIRGAELSRDFEADRLLRRVRELLETPQAHYRDIVVLLQALIDRPGDAFVAEDGSVFRPVRFVAERLLAGLGQAGLDAYRMEADGQAKALLGIVATSRDAEALATVVRHYFLSSYGDDAAYLLGCLHLDEHDFAKARRLFRRVLAEHPDPSVPRADTLLRLALASARCGDLEGARAALKLLAAGGGEQLNPVALRAVEGEVASPAPSLSLSLSSLLWPALPSDAFERPRALAIPAWRHVTGVVPRDLPPNSFGQLSDADAGALRNRMLGRWENSALIPSGYALAHGGAFLLKSQGTLICLDAASGHVKWQTKPAGAQPAGNPRLAMHYMHAGQGHPVETLHFDDQIGRAIQIIGDTVYHIEEFYQNRWGQQRMGMIVVARPGQTQPKQLTGSVLAAYDVRTGAPRWRVGRTLEESDPLGAVQFLAAPVPSGGRLVVPFEKSGELWLAGLDPANGACVWQTFLCSFGTPRVSMGMGTGSWSLVGLAAQGSDVYVASGQGFVFALDGTDGSLHWASQYPQDLDKSGTSPFGRATVVRGWRDGLAAIRGAKLIVLPTDAECVMVLDVASGKITARHRTPGLQYCLGLDGTTLYAGSAAAVRAMDAASGRRLWERKLEGDGQARGRGLVTPDAVWVPSGRHILRLSPRKGEVEAVVRVATDDEEPVGNLACDGERLAIVGLTHTYAVANAAPKLAEAERRVASLEKSLAELAPDAPAERRSELAKGRAEALFARAGLRLKYDRMAEAVDDLRAAAREAADSKLKAQVRRELVGCLAELARREPERRPVLLREALGFAKGTAEEGQVVMPLVAWHRERGELEQAVELLLAFAQGGKGAPVELEAGGDVWKASPRAMATGAIQRLLAEEGAKVAPLLARHAEAGLAAARGTNDTAALRTILRLYPGTRAAIEAGLKAAATEAASGIFEKAEAVLIEMARSQHAPTAASGLAALADLYEKQGWFWQARKAWELLAADFANTPVGLGEGATNGKALAARRLAEKALAEADSDMFKGVPEPPWRLVWSSQHQPGFAQPLRIRQSPAAGPLGFSQFLEQHLLFQRHGSDGRLICRRLSDGQTLYEAPLARPPHYLQFQAHQGARDGHIALLQGNNAWEGFGLVSGKTIWSRTQPVGQPGVRYFGAAVAWRTNLQYLPGGGAPAGCVVLRPNQSTVSVLELATGEERWQRSFGRRQVAWAQEAGRYVLLSLENAECWICDALSGERIGTVELGAGQHPGLPRSFLATRLGVLYQRWEPAKGGNKVSLLELPSGKVLWNLELGQEYRAPMLLNDDLFCLQGSNRGIEVRELATGAVKISVPQEKIQGFVSNLTVSPDGKTLGFWAHNGRGQMRAGTVDIATGNVVQGPSGTGYLGGIDLAELWARSGDLIPWMTMDPPVREGNTVRHTNLRTIGFTRKSDGKTLEGHRLPTARPDGKFENVNQIFVQDGRLILARHNGLEVFGHDPNPSKPDKLPEGKGQATEKK